MVIICVLGSYVDGFYGYSQAKASRCSTISFIQIILIFFVKLTFEFIIF